ncbi:MAG TPA: dephospho-CoA kinase [Vicinamibacterales bacterium]|jgi:dephospho-CoA kinase
MLKIGLTGGIATGKSYVLERLRQRGVPCLDADDISHGVTAAGTEATSAIAARFGEAVLAADGSVNRQALGPIVFADATARRDLEAILHPAIYRAIRAGLRGFELLGHYPFAVVAVPLLFETGHQKDYDRVVVTTCPPELQMQRLRERGLNQDAAKQRIDAQWPTADKTLRADFVIHTDASFEETDRQVEEVVAALKQSVG